MIGIVSIFFSVLTAIFTYLLKEPEFLKEIEDEYKTNAVDLSKPETLKIMTKLHLVGGVKNYYKELNVYRPILIFVILAIVTVGGILSLNNFLQTNKVEDNTITIFSTLVLLFLLFSFMLSLFIYLFSLIIKKI